jgi:two-component system sensor histidine kinase FlrB
MIMPMQSMENALKARSLAALDSVSRELDLSYRDLQGQVQRLTDELAASRSARLRELGEKERLLARLSSLVSVLPGGVLLLDSGNRVRDANPEALDLLGEPLIGERWADVAARHPALRDRGREAQSDAAFGGGRHLSVSSRSLDSHGEQVVLITDTTQLHDLQQQLGRRQRLAALGEMAARLAHQIRTPLSSTTLYLAQLTREDLGAAQRRRIGERLAGRLSHMEGLIESMLSFVRGSPSPREPLRLRQVFEGLTATVAPRLPATARLTVTPVDDTLRLNGSLDDLVGALSNLVMNALEVGGERVHVDLWAGATSRDWLQLRVRDDGPGIAADILPRLFDPFFTTRARGTGLGLAVVAMTVEQHGGEVRARNHRGGGAEFLIDLPILSPGSQRGSHD